MELLVPLWPSRVYFVCALCHERRGQMAKPFHLVIVFISPSPCKFRTLNFHIQSSRKNWIKNPANWISKFFPLLYADDDDETFTKREWVIESEATPMCRRILIQTQNFSRNKNCEEIKVNEISMLFLVRAVLSNLIFFFCCCCWTLYASSSGRAHAWGGIGSSRKNILTLVSNW